MSEEIDKLTDAIVEALENCPTTDVVGALYRALVAVSEKFVEGRGGVVANEIRFTHPGMRDVTLHAIRDEES